MRNALLCLFLAATVAAPGFAAASFTADADATGVVVLWFAGQEVTAEVRAQFTLSGTLVLEGVGTAFSVTARASGPGSGNLDTLAVEAWVAVDGAGMTDAGDAVTLRGGIAITSLDAASTTSTSGRGSGAFYFLLTTTAGTWAIEGEAVGEASGSFVVPDDPHSMQLSGAGSFVLAGEPRVWATSENAPFPQWPGALLAALERQAAEQESAAGGK